MNTQELKTLIKDSIREVLREERFLLYKSLVPMVSDAEQRAIETEIGSPADYEDEEFIDLTDWVHHGGQIPEISD